MNGMQQISEDTLQAFRSIWLRKDDGQPNNELIKAITTGTGLVNIDLQAPSKKLVPYLFYIRQKIQRKPGNGGTATTWRQISAYNAPVNSIGGVPEGVRAAVNSITAANGSSNYVTFGGEDYVSEEAVAAGEGFEDLLTSGTMLCTKKVFVQEETEIICGNQTLQLGTTPTPTTSASGSGATLPAATYYVSCVALTAQGFFENTLTTGVLGQVTKTSADGSTFTVNMGTAAKSVESAGQAVTLGQTLTVSVAAVAGAAAYAWYVGSTSGATRLEAITVNNTTTFSAALNGTRQLISAVSSTDYSYNTTLSFDGLLNTALKSGANSYTKNVAGTLTTNGRGGVTEIDTMLRAMWDSYKISPDFLYMSSQQATDIDNKAMTTSQGSLIRLNQQVEDTQPGGNLVVAGNGIVSYWNRYNNGTGKLIPLIIHPNMPTGMILGFTMELPIQYQDNETNTTFDMHIRKDYYLRNWPMRTRKSEFGVYAQQALAVYATFAIGVLYNITAG